VTASAWQSSGAATTAANAGATRAAMSLKARMAATGSKVSKAAHNYTAMDDQGAAALAGVGSSLSAGSGTTLADIIGTLAVAGLSLGLGACTAHADPPKFPDLNAFQPVDPAPYTAAARAGGAASGSMSTVNGVFASAER
ncbi:MAG TPA: hypothetical protein VF299_07795, partial [Mycobacterium sp.]